MGKSELISEIVFVLVFVLVFVSYLQFRFLYQERSLQLDFGEDNVLLKEARYKTRLVYGNVTFPEQTRVGVRYALHVHITPEKRDEKAPSLEIVFDEIKSVRVNVIVAFYGDAFAIEGSNVQSVEVTAENYLDPLVFWVTPQKVGEHQLYVDFFQEGRYLGRREVQTTVHPAESQAMASRMSFVASAPLASVPEPVLESRSTSLSALAINPLWPSPDLVIRVQRSGEGKYQYQMSFASKVLGLTFKETAVQGIFLKLDHAPHTYLQGLFEQLDYRHDVTRMNEDVFWDRLNGLGATLYEQLFPEELKTIYWEKIHNNKKIKSIQILSDEAWIPWELIRPYRRVGDIIEEDPFFSEQFQLTRWFAGCNPGAPRFHLHTIQALYGDLNLDAVEKEREAMDDLASRKGLMLEKVVPTTSAVFALLKLGGFDCLHFACHGEFDSKNPDHSQLRLSHRQQLQPSDISGERMVFGKDRPLVFLNACETGRTDHALVGLGGWIPQFLRAGACAFVGTLWEASDASAHHFAVAFYSHLLDGETIGFAAQQARLAVKKTGDPTWLAYTVFGDPNLRI